MIYLDNAATTYPKPISVINAVNEALYRFGNPGRGGHALSMAAAEELYLCRKVAAEMFGASPERVIFTSGATHSLNMAVFSVRDREGAILISSMEHNAVVRPVTALKREVRVFDAAPQLSGDERTIAILSSVSSLSLDAVMLVCTAASNICSVAMPIREIGKYCREHDIIFVVDAAQAGGIYDINVDRDFIDVLCLPSHKGLYGPMGGGMMILGEGVTLSPLILGGSGVNSKSAQMPDYPPERYEAGTLPVPIIAGLRKGIEFVKRKTPTALRKHEQHLCSLLCNKLTALGVNVYLPSHIGGCVLFNVDGLDSEQVAARLDKQGICTRAGLHCAPLAHKTLGSEGAVRVSFGAFNTEADVKMLTSCLMQMI